MMQQRLPTPDDTGPRRIVLLQTQAEGAGAQEISRILAQGLTARGHDVHQVFLFRRTSAFDAAANAVFCADRRPTGLASLTRMLALLLGHLRRLRPDVVLCFQHYGNLIGAPMARLSGAPAVIANLNSAKAQMPAIVREIDTLFGTIGLYSAIVANSKNVEDGYGDHPRRYVARLGRIDHGFEPKTSPLSRPAARAALGLPAAPQLLGCAARLHPLKNISAAIRLLAHESRWHLALAGQGSEKIALEGLAAELGCAERVHFLGELSPGGVGTFLRALDVFVFPSMSETFGLAVVEAAQAGVPVVANRLDVLEEVLAVGTEPCALFVDVNDTPAFAAQVRRVLDDTMLAETLTARSRQLNARYSFDTMVDRYAALIENVLRGRGSQFGLGQPCN
jgi:glycosyltransferase involved in cell wall biosynthesis